MITTQPAIGKAHARRLREIYRSAGWPCQDPLEIELLAAGLLHRVHAPSGHESLRVSDAGVQLLATTLAANRKAFSAHEALVERVAREMSRAGRIAWRGLSLRAQVPGDEGAGNPLRWCIAMPDVFSIRNTSVATYVDPIVHEVKVRRADLLSDLRSEAKRAAYLDLGECWYVLGCDARGRPIAQADEVPAECGVMFVEGSRLIVARSAPRRQRNGLPFGVWMALAKATPLPVTDDPQPML
jgi:prepilin signal peptidase PulO-like enzyme (type II secretory pathway)